MNLTKEQFDLLESCINGRTVGNASYSPDWIALKEFGLIKIRAVDSEKYKSKLAQQITITERGLDLLLERLV